MQMTFSVDGLAELDNMLQELPAAVAGRIGSRALREGAKVILAEARRHVPIGNRVSLGGENQPGQLLRAIKIVSRRVKAKNRRVVMVTVSSRESGINPHWIEFGTAPIRRAKGDGFLYFTINGKLIRKKWVVGVTAKPFMRPAVDTAAQQAIAAIAQSIGPETEKEAARLAKKGARARR